MAAPIKYQHPLTHYCEVYGKKIATIKRYSQKGLPLDDPKAMETHLAMRAPKSHRKAKETTVPVDTKAAAKAESEKVEETEKLSHERKLIEAVTSKWDGVTGIVPTEDKDDPPRVPGAEAPMRRAKPGAAETLKRMESREAQLHDELQALEASGAGDDKIILKEMRWTKVAESVRKLDDSIEAARRSAGELIPREECEKIAMLAGIWTDQALKVWLLSDAPALVLYVQQALDAKLEGDAITVQVAKKLIASLRTILATTLRESKSTVGALPDWAIKAVKEGFAS